MFNGHCWDPNSANWSLASDQCQKVTYVRLRSVEMLQDEQNPLELAPQFLIPFSQATEKCGSNI